jgi:magnesium-transporting ATPase (P-type)
VLFDKTGTLTQDGLSVQCVHAARVADGDILLEAEGEEPTSSSSSSSRGRGRFIFSPPISECHWVDSAAAAAAAREKEEEGGGGTVIISAAANAETAAEELEAHLKRACATCQNLSKYSRLSLVRQHSIIRQ